MAKLSLNWIKKHYTFLFSFSGTPYISKKLSSFLLCSLLYVDLLIPTTGHFLYLSIPLRIYGSPVNFQFCSTPEKLICFSFPSLINTDRKFISVDGTSCLSNLPEPMHAVQALHLFSTAFSISDHQSMLLWSNIFVEPQWLTCSAFNNCFIS